MPQSNCITLELGKVWHCLEKNKKCWILEFYCRKSNRLIDWEIGGHNHVAVKWLVDRLKARGRKYFTDHHNDFALAISEL